VNRAPFHNPQAGVFPENLAVSFGNFEGLNNDNTDNEVGTTTFGWIDNLSIVHGRNTFKVGMEVRRIRLNQGITQDNAITFVDNTTLCTLERPALEALAGDLVSGHTESLAGQTLGAVHGCSIRGIRNLPAPPGFPSGELTRPGPERPHPPLDTTARN
jgi:hypothetical protein